MFEDKDRDNLDALETISACFLPADVRDSPVFRAAFLSLPPDAFALTTKGYLRNEPSTAFVLCLLEHKQVLMARAIIDGSLRRYTPRLWEVIADRPDALALLAEDCLDNLRARAGKAKNSENLPLVSPSQIKLDVDDGASISQTIRSGASANDINLSPLGGSFRFDFDGSFTYEGQPSEFDAKAVLSVADSLRSGHMYAPAVMTLDHLLRTLAKFEGCGGPTVDDALRDAITEMLRRIGDDADRNKDPKVHVEIQELASRSGLTIPVQLATVIRLLKEGHVDSAAELLHHGRLTAAQWDLFVDPIVDALHARCLRFVERGTHKLASEVNALWTRFEQLVALDVGPALAVFGKRRTLAAVTIAIQVHLANGPEAHDEALAFCREAGVELDSKSFDKLVREDADLFMLACTHAPAYIKRLRSHTWVFVKTLARKAAQSDPKTFVSIVRHLRDVSEWKAISALAIAVARIDLPLPFRAAKQAIADMNGARHMSSETRRAWFDAVLSPLDGMMAGWLGHEIARSELKALADEGLQLLRELATTRAEKKAYKNLRWAKS